MSVYSQNGFVANDTSVLAWTTVSGTGVRFRLRKGPVTDVLTYLASRFDDEVEDIDTAQTYRQDAKPSIPGGEPSTLLDDWSYAPRPIRGSTTTLSNHASGTAIDLNATQHPRGKLGTFTAAQVRAVRAILADLRDPATGRCVVRWGEDYQSAPVDGMHFEIDADEKAVARVAAGLEEDMATPRENWGYNGADGKYPADAWRMLRDIWHAALTTLALTKALAAKDGLSADEIEQLVTAAVESAIADQAPTLAAALKAALPSTGTPTQEQLEQALRSVLGSLDNHAS